MRAEPATARTLRVVCGRARVTRLICAWVAGAAWGCAPDATLAPVDPAAYLRVGADFDADATAFAGGLRERGWVVRRGPRSERFAAVEAHHREQSLVRVWSSRGLVVAVDAPSEGARTVALGRVASPAADQVVIGARDDAWDRTCHAIVRIDRRRGTAHDVTPRYDDLGGEGCVERWMERDSGPGALALFIVRWPELSPAAPHVAVPFAPPLWDPWLEPDYLEAEVRRRRRALARHGREASGAGTGGGAVGVHERSALRLRLGIELAALSHLGGGDRAAQLRAFDDSVGASPPLAATRARAFIARGWRDDHDELPSIDSPPATEN